MASSAEDFLSFAKKLNSADCAKDEITQRTIVNRGYYAVFHLATNLADRLALPLPMAAGGGSHQKLFNRFIESTQRPESERLALQCIGYVASRTLKPYRFSADYDVSKSISKDAAAQTLANADKVFEKAAQLISDSSISVSSKPPAEYSKVVKPPL